MQTELTQFSNLLTCQYPHSSARKHTISDLALFFSWAEKPPSAADGNKYVAYSGGPGAMYGFGYAEGYLCNSLGRTCSMPSPSEIEQSIRGICGGGEEVIIGGINISLICWGVNLNGLSQMATFYIGFEAGAGSGGSVAIPLSLFGVAPNPSLGWRWALDNQQNGTTYDEILVGGW
jgi:hypothetical protein